MAATEETPLWVIVLIDCQNVYNCARDAFGFGNQGSIAGNIDPLKLALHLAEGVDEATGRARKLQQVRAYRGRPDNARAAKTYSAWRSQTAAWQQRGGSRFSGCYRDLRYHRDGTAREKGIDVWLAVDLVRIAVKEEADHVVVVSSDTDLVPALELCIQERGPEFAEVAGWQGHAQSAALLDVPGHALTRRVMDQAVYQLLHDPTDYTTPAKYRQKSSWDQQIDAEGRRPRRT